MTKINTIISGHGNFASGIESSIKLLSSIPENYVFINFLKDMSEEQLTNKFKNAIKPTERTVFFTDLAGGTPFKAAVKLSYQDRLIEVVAGCNLGSLLETIYNEYDTSLEYANALVSISKQFTTTFSMVEDKTLSSTDVEEDGI